jgi:hypothetical protein
MGHHDNAHGRVFRGLKKDSNMTPASKRATGYSDNVHQFIHRRQALGHNTNGDRIVMHVPEGFPEKDTSNSEKTTAKLAQKAEVNDDDAVETVYEQVFKTLDQTFDGPPQFFSTQSVAHTSTSATQAAVQTTAAAAAAGNSRQQSDDDQDQTPSRQPASQVAATSAASAAEPTITSSSATQRAATSAEKDNTSSTQSAIHVSSSSIVTGDVTSTHGAQLADNTASMVVGTPLSATHSATPETEQTGLTGGAKAGLAVGILFGLALVFGLIFFCWRRKKSHRELEEYNEKSAMGGGPVPINRFSSDSDRLRRTSTQTSATAPRLSLRPVTQFLPNLTAGNAEQKKEQNPFGDAAALSEKSGASHDRANSVNSDSNASVDSADRPTTSGSGQVATAAAVPVAARGPNNVHRVQLEFKPSMEDELELKSGQLVRMLHEYDDGWVSSCFPRFHERSLLTHICRLSAPRWIAARRALSLAHVFPRCPSSPVAHLRKTALCPPDSTTCLRRHRVLMSPAHSPQPNKATSVLRRLMVCLLASPCQVRLFRQEC